MKHYFLVFNQVERGALGVRTFKQKRVDGGYVVGREGGVLRHVEHAFEFVLGIGLFAFEVQ